MYFLWIAATLSSQSWFGTVAFLQRDDFGKYYKITVLLSLDKSITRMR